jgi:acyl-CoA thioester hydrolase
MSAIFQAVFRVRHYECDIYGHLNNVNYVRYMQEAALNASANVGWTAERYQSIGCQWVIRETDIEYLQALVWNDEVQITTYVIDFRRVQSRRRYEFHRLSDGVLVARADTNWVFLDTKTMRPTSIPDEVIHYFAPKGLTQVERAEKFPETAAMPDAAFKIQKRVEWRDIDTLGHVNNAAYMTYCEDISTQVGRDLGWSMQSMMDEGFALVMRRFRILYLDSAILDDDVEIMTWFSDLKRATAVRHYQLTRVSDGTLLAKARALIVCFDLKKQRPIRIPQHFLNDFLPNMSKFG